MKDELLQMISKLSNDQIDKLFSFIQELKKKDESD